MSEDTSHLEDQSLSDIRQQYKGKWVAILVTKRGKNRQPDSGKVVASSHDRYQLRQQIAQLNEVCILFAGELPYPLFL